MQICINCFQELFDSDKECIKCKSQNILSTEEYNECKKFFMHHDKDITTYTEHPYSTYLKYINHKTRREKFEYDRLHPSYTVGKGNVTTGTTQTYSQEFIPRCPTCGSTSVEKISLTQKAVGGALFGLFSSNVRNTMHCKNCGYKW